jgi:hypothetical protein
MKRAHDLVVNQGKSKGQFEWPKSDQYDTSSAILVGEDGHIVIPHDDLAEALVPAMEALATTHDEEVATTGETLDNITE